jgi:hypothetical protein
MNLMPIVKLFFQKLYAYFVFFYKLNANCVFYPAVTCELTLAHPSILESIVAMDDFYPSLVCYHCRDIVVAMGRMSVATVADDPFLQWCVVVVYLPLDHATSTFSFPSTINAPAAAYNI